MPDLFGRRRGRRRLAAILLEGGEGVERTLRIHDRHPVDAVEPVVDEAATTVERRSHLVDRLERTGDGCVPLRNTINRRGDPSDDNGDLVTDDGYDVTLLLRFDLGPLQPGEQTEEVCYALQWGVGLLCATTAMLSEATITQPEQKQSSVSTTSAATEFLRPDLARWREVVGLLFGTLEAAAPRCPRLARPAC